jgi:hypothetical protein
MKNRPATQERIGIENHHAWVCPCGNTEHGMGFHHWDRVGRTYDNSGNSRFFRCDKCSRVIDSETGNILGIETIDASI